ncbi:general secretion pathway protein GspK [Desulfobacter latus]|uniref:General secretion pathway protein GspK n=1 Tax=Desulfobacter latus TaxID=2292 RepID=A0A850T850_9BACT|nr:type II secretion system protein GspK [Desulfobacter latus]NWH05632.1 general secretion pathway protein GspK [Desulfobacter latus]
MITLPSLSPPLKNQKGMALLVTLSIIAVILAVSFEMNRRVRLRIMTTAQDKTEYILEETARTGLEIAKAVLQQDASENHIDSVQDKWADPDFLNALITSLGYARETLSLTITDELGKIQVNALVKEFPGHVINPEQRTIWENLLSFFISKDKSEDERDPDEIINCLKDWLDSNDDDLITGVSGAESDYYQSLSPPYDCANRPIYDLNELFRVKGITKDFLAISQDMANFFSDMIGEVPDLTPEKLFTAFGAQHNVSKDKGIKKYNYPGKININTAPIPVIAAILPWGKQDLAVAIDAYRSEKSDESDEESFTNNLGRKGWYADAAGLTSEEKAAMEKKITYRSHIFSVESQATANGQSLTLQNIILRKKDKNGKWYCKPLVQRIK